jgi:hypothetical protein
MNTKSIHQLIGNNAIISRIMLVDVFHDLTMNRTIQIIRWIQLLTHINCVNRSFFLSEVKEKKNFCWDELLGELLDIIIAYR